MHVSVDSFLSVWFCHTGQFSRAHIVVADCNSLQACTGA
jgi:hypothetical protein